MATEIALDPLTYLALGTTAGLTTAGKAARAAGILEHAPSIATAQRLGRPVEEVSSIWQKAGKVAESVRTGKGGVPKDWNVVVKEGEKEVLKPVPLIEQAQKKGWVPSGSPRVNVGKRVSRTNLSLRRRAGSPTRPAGTER